MRLSKFLRAASFSELGR